MDSEAVYQNQQWLLTDLFGHTVGLLWGAGHHALRNRDAGLLQQPDARVLVQRQTPLLLLLQLQRRHMSSKQTRGHTQDLQGHEEEEEEEEDTGGGERRLLNFSMVLQLNLCGFLSLLSLNVIVSFFTSDWFVEICGYHGNMQLLF